MEYSGEEQAICAVGLVKPRSGVFVEAIQYLLVLCTTVEVSALLLPPLVLSSNILTVWGPGALIMRACLLSSFP